MGLDREEAMRLASSFGAGMGGMRETCGAVTGMFLVAGCLKGYASPTDQEAKTVHYARIRHLADQFRKQQGTLICRELLQSLPGKLQENPLPRTPEYYKIRPCVRFVETAAKLLEEML
jgi:C_GCAxxG_C_C family probable redox protein